MKRSTKGKIVGWVLLCTGWLSADPCGMVPPITLDGQPPQTIERVGEQLTYVFRKGDIQTFVIHPGFEGDVDQFGMLIPFPESPALRKVPDNTFEQIAHAVEPPVIKFWVNPPTVYRSSPGAPSNGLELRSSGALRQDEVRVVKEEAVGMYEVAVLEAGSASALKRWMDDHSYRFPDGMESVCEDYVTDGWCFVAVKTRVGRKAGVDPRPGMRSVSPDKPEGANFTGKVQAMGFRFHSPQFVVPMRLSAFNGGDLNNTVYILAEHPVAAANLPKEFVRKQIHGEKLLSNLRDPLPYELMGGDADDMSPNRWKELERRRDPKPYTAVAGELFSHDLLASATGELSHSFEEKEKQLLDIGESLGLRGGRLDSLHHEILLEEQKEAKDKAVDELQSMTLTVVEGDFPRDVVANENIRFERYRLPGSKAVEREAREFAWTVSSTLVSQMDSGLATTQDLLVELADPKTAPAALSALAQKGPAATPFLLRHVKNKEADLVGRGYALTLLSKQSDGRPAEQLRGIFPEINEPLMRLWVGAALVNLAQDPSQLLRELNFVPLNQLPELQRPVALKLEGWNSELTLDEQLRFLARGQGVSGRGVSPTISSVVGPQLKSASPSALTSRMFQSSDQDVRRLAASVLAGKAGTEQGAVLSAVGEALALSSSANRVPWAGGALFLPQFTNLTATQAKELIAALVRWSVWSEIHEVPDEQRKPLENNLRSYNLWSRAGSGDAGWRQASGASGWLKAYGKVAGKAAAREILVEQNVSTDSDLWIIVRK